MLTLLARVKYSKEPGQHLKSQKITYHHDFKHFLLLQRSQKFTQACSYQQQQKQSLPKLCGFTGMLTYKCDRTLFSLWVLSVQLLTATGAKGRAPQRTSPSLGNLAGG